MTFADKLTTAKSYLSAREVALAVSPILSVRTVQDWLAARRTPPPWTHSWILERVRRKGIKKRGAKAKRKP
jgi:hypothetical protein